MDAASAAPRHHPPHAAQPAAPSNIALPVGFQPEGIAVAGGRVCSGLRVTGEIFVADLRTGRGQVLSRARGPGTPSLGREVDGQRLGVAGGSGGDGRVVDTRTGRVLERLTFTARTSFVNDVVLAGRLRLLLRGRTLCVVQNRLNRVAVVRLEEAGTSGRVVRTITSPAFDVPGTVAASGRYLYLPNARSGATDPAATAYGITRAER